MDDGTLPFLLIVLMVAALAFWLIYMERKHRDVEWEQAEAERLKRARRDAQERAERERQESQAKAEREKQYALEAEYAATHRKLQLEVDARRKKLAKVQGGAPKKVLVAELELAEKEAELEFLENGASMTDEKREEFKARLNALREQIKKEKQGWWA